MKMNHSSELIKKAPDGGWGWFVCLGSSLITLSLRSLDPSFGLLFHEPLKNLKIDSTGTSLIMGILDAIVNFSGLIVGPLLKKYSYRKVAFFGSLLSSIGLILTSRTNSMISIICTYSILGGLGTGLAIASSFVALNTFFDKKRGQAVGFSMAGTTLAMMLVPQMIHLLLDTYGFRGATLIIGGWSLHSVIGACMLRPLETKKIQSAIKTIKGVTERDALLNKIESIEIKPSGDKTKSEIIGNEGNVKKGTGNEFFEKIKETFDLDLLKNGTYLNVIFGLSLCYVAESNFKLMTPFFLSNIGMSNAEIAFCLSLTAFTDILARISLPTIFDRLAFKKRNIFWAFSILLGIGRSIMAEQSKGTFLMIIFIIIGFLRGATLVNLNLSVSECCSLNKLPNAFGIFMVSKGLFVVLISPLIGYIRDVSESYAICMHMMTLLISITFITWAMEYVYKSLTLKQSSKQIKNETGA